jgi:UDP-perosamine 4-acetyltransferase
MEMDKRVVVVGAGGHAKVIADLLRASGWSIVGCTDRDPTPRAVNGMDVLGTEDEVLPVLREAGIDKAFVALGDNRLRRKVVAKVAAAGFGFVNAIGRSAIVSPSAIVAHGCAIMEGAVVNAGAEIGAFAIVNTNTSIDHDCVVGSFAHVAPGSALAGCVRVGDGAFLGVGTRVVPQVEIAAGAIVGAGAVVARSIETAGTWVGVPAKLIKASLETDWA